MSSATLSRSEDKAVVKNAQPASKHKILTATIARLYIGNFQTLSWTFTNIWGALILVKDLDTNNYFLRIVDMMGKGPVWEHELYIGFKLDQLNNFFYTFSGDEKIFGFDFSNINEAQVFHSKVNSRASKIKGQKQQQSINSSELDKEALDMINNPTDPRWKTLLSGLSQYGVSEKQLKDRNSREFIMGFVVEHGGLQKILSINGSLPNELSTVPVKPVSPPPPPPPRRNRLPPAAPPSRNSRNTSNSVRSSSPASVSSRAANNAIVQPPTNAGISSPPPPPYQSPVQPPRSEQVSNTTPTPPSLPSRPGIPLPKPDDKRNMLLASIRGASVSSLRKVNVRDSSSSLGTVGGSVTGLGDGASGGVSSPNAGKAGGLSDALAQALSKRNKAIAGSDSESEDDENWD
ncbi:hypothetical protein BB559_003461 [Furculomyces boomerangus]|uniref:WH1 domain-containing protein n=2 Tax=Harpellales TaxID=61421 RepID=A0A2T9YL35_9FUNG|nr:hypothetical protein BB559_003461 [Furculomyces boomerangus]PWA01446.1 hypothetical protein BB558_002452 [Smittium angustum]